MSEVLGAEPTVETPKQPGKGKLVWWHWLIIAIGIAAVIAGVVLGVVFGLKAKRKKEEEEKRQAAEEKAKETVKTVLNNKSINVNDLGNIIDGVAAWFKGKTTKK